MLINGTNTHVELIPTLDFVYQYDHHPVWPVEKYNINIKSSKHGYLKGKFKESQMVVKCVELPDGKRYKLDGNSRSRAIIDKHLTDYPEFLFLVVVKVKNQAEATERFLAEDTQEQAQTKNALLLSIAYKECNMTITSPAMTGTCSVFSALNFNINGNAGGSPLTENKMEWVSDYRRELLRLDTLGLDKKVQGKRVITVITMTIFIKLLREFGSRALDVIEDFLNRKGFDEVYEVLDNDDYDISASKKQHKYIGEWYHLFKEKLV